MSHFPTWALVVLALATALAGTAFAGDGPILVLDGDLDVGPGVNIVTVPVGLVAFDHSITSVVFSIDLDLNQLVFDSSDDDGDGVPDAVRFPQGAPSFTFVNFDAADSQGELDVALSDLSGLPLPLGVFMVFDVMTIQAGSVANWIDFSANPAPSFGNDQGQSVPGTTLVLPLEIFADGFESGDVSAWSVSVPGFDGDDRGR